MDTETKIFVALFSLLVGASIYAVFTFGVDSCEDYDTVKVGNSSMQVCDDD